MASDQRPNQRVLISVEIFGFSSSPGQKKDSVEECWKANRFSRHNKADDSYRPLSGMVSFQQWLLEDELRTARPSAIQFPLTFQISVKRIFLFQLK